MIPVIPEPPAMGGPPYEHCAFCRAPTRFWTDLKSRTEGEQVACCKACAKKHGETEVPTKDMWFANEEAEEAPVVVPKLRRPRAGLS